MFTGEEFVVMRLDESLSSEANTRAFALAAGFALEDNLAVSEM